jgi:cell wall-associated NlpC family hydrolase
MRIALLTITLITFIACRDKETNEPVAAFLQSTINIASDTMIDPRASQQINTGTTKPGELLDFAKTLIGTPYKYGSVDPSVGFDCSGFLTYTFNHFHIAVPRSSIDFTHAGKTVELAAAKPGDLLLFTGTDSTNRAVGHIGIITSYENGVYNFIHSSSGKAKGVTITPLSNYYAVRFVKAIRVFPQNDL